MKRGTTALRALGLVILALAACRADGDTTEPTALVKVAPATLSTSNAWSLFDRSIASSYTPGSDPVRATLDRAEQIWAVKVYGSAPYRLTVTGANTAEIGFDAIDLSAVGPGWHVFPSNELVSTKDVELRFEPLGRPGTIPEIELWAVDDQTSRPAAVDLSAAELPAGFVAVPADPAVAALKPSECGTFTVAFSRSPAELRRAYLSYSSIGLFRPFSLQRSINGLATQGGTWLAGDPGTHNFFDELDPSSLRLGPNSVRLCMPSDATDEIALSDLRIVGELDRGVQSAASIAIGQEARDGTALLDGDPKTTVQLAASEQVTITLDRLIAPDTLELSGEHLPSATSVECVDRTGTATELAVRATSSASGLALALDGIQQACAKLVFTPSSACTLGEVRVVGSGAAEPVDWPRLVVTSPTEHFGDRAWVAGFVAHPRTMSGAVRVAVDGLAVDGRTGDFGVLVHRSGDLSAPWPVQIDATLPDGSTQLRQVVLDHDQRAQLASATNAAASTPVTAQSSPFGKEGQVIVGHASPTAPTSIQLGSKVSAHIPGGAVGHPTDITIHHLSVDEVPPLDPGMVNVTAPRGHGYEFLPHGQHFAKPIEVVVPFDPQLIPDEMSAKDVHTYFFDPVARRWEPLDRTAIDVAENTIHSATSHFTIMIDAVLAVPKNATPLSLDPTALSSIGAASPAANIDLIEPPQASSTGDARTGLPIRVPAGRGAYTPALSISYSSSAGNGWLGVGWDLQVSSIEIDTRWGVPSYAPDEEPRYLLDGAELVPTLETDGPGCTVGNGRRYHTRIEGAFAYIERCERNGRFHFEVRDRDGTLYVYGPDAPGNVGNAALVDPHDPTPNDPQHIYRWYLRRVVDVHGNTTTFDYTTDNLATGEPSTEVYPATIEYTGHPDSPAYAIDFVLDDGTRPDRIVSGRAGFKTVTRRLLRAVRVRFHDQVIREYVLGYQSGEFDKSLLASIAVYGAGGCGPSSHAFGPANCTAGGPLFHVHRFDYFREDEALDDPVAWKVSDDPSPDNATLGKGGSSSLSGGLTLGGNVGGVNLGASLTGSSGNRSEHLGVYDVNGDGLPDQVYATIENLHPTIHVLYNQSRPGLALNAPLLSAVGPAINGLTALGYEETGSWGVSAFANAEKDGIGGGISAGYSNSTTRAQQFVTDVNGDGFMDLVHPDPNGNPFQVSVTASLGQPCANGTAMCFSPSSYNIGAALDPHSDPMLSDYQKQIAARSFIGDPVVQWIAPFAGKIEVTGTAQKLHAGGSDGVAIDLYHQDDRLETFSFGPNDTAQVAFPPVPATIDVNAGDAIYVRVRTGADQGIGNDSTLQDLVDAHVSIAYKHACTAETGCADVSDPQLAHDPTGAPVFAFDSNRDFRLAGSSAPFVAPVDGTLEVRANIFKLPSAADVRVCVQRFVLTSGSLPNTDVPCSTNSVSGITTLTAGSMSVLPLVASVGVSAGDQVLVRMESDLSFDPASVQLVPQSSGAALLAYTDVCLPASDGSGSSCSQDADTIATVPVSTAHFGAFVAIADPVPHVPFVTPRTGEVEVDPPSAPLEPFIYAIRSDRQGVIALRDCRITSCLLTPEVFRVGTNESLTIELVTESGSAGPSTVTVKYPSSGLSYSAPLVRRNLAPAETLRTPFVGGYRGWHAGVWNENEAFQPTELIADYPSLFFPDALLLLSQDRIQQILRTVVQPQPSFAGTTATGSQPAWVAPGGLAFIGADAMNAGTIGVSANDGDAPGSFGGLFDGNYVRLSGTRSYFLGASVGVATDGLFGGIDFNATHSDTQTTQDVIDMNGDGIADVLTADSALQGLFNTVTGASPQGFDAGGALRVRSGNEYASGFSGDKTCTPRITSSGRYLACDNKDGADTGTFGLSGGTAYGIDRSETTKDLIDVNGDGLPDLVERSGSTIWVQLNLGHRFGAKEVFGQDLLSTQVDAFQSDEGSGGFADSTSNALEHDTTLTKHSSGGFSVNLVVAKVGVSASSIQSASRTTRQLVDINGDGLPDLLLKKAGENEIHVQLNRGGDFGPEILWNAGAYWCTTADLSGSSCPLGNDFFPFGLDNVFTNADVLAATGTQGGSSVSASISIGPVGGDISSGSGTDTYELALYDIDGDGVPDHVLRHGIPGLGGKIYVKHNRVTGKANLLETVHRPLGGSFTIDYQRTANTVDLPHSRYVMTHVDVDDGSNIAGFPSPDVTTDITYQNGFYHRGEKEFFGFAKVITKRADGVTLEDDYENQTYALHGRLLRETRRDGLARMFRDHVITYEVSSVEGADGNPVTVDPACIGHLHPLLTDDACTPRFPVVVRDDDTRAEGAAASKTRTIRDTSHDRFGNVLESLDTGDDAIATDDLYSAATYQNDTSNWILGRATSLTVRAGNATGPILRSRAGEYDDQGDLIAVHVDTGAGVATTTMSYDAFGNLAHEETPPNEAGQTQTFDVTYDPEVDTYPASTTDGFGYTSTAQYDVRFGIATTETDINHVSLRRTIDQFGRVATVSGPYDTSGPGLTLEYFPEESPPRAVTVMHPSAPPDYTGPVPASTTSVTFVDGLGRAIELRKNAMVADGSGAPQLGMTTSGLVVRDAVGHVVTTQNPFFTPGFNTSFAPPVTTQQTHITYDAMDRPFQTVYPDGAVETATYAVALDPSGAQLFLARSVDPDGHLREAFLDHLGRTRTFREHPDAGAGAVTRYDYLPTGELSRIVDAEGNVTTLTYDLRGLRTALDNPDDGLIEEHYDLMGNRVALIEPNHRALGVQVHYVYDRDRLTKVDYPSKPDVTFTYGRPNAASFGAGRIIRVDDETGSQVHEYGALGEVRRTVRTVVESGPGPSIFDLHLTSDSFGRQLRVGYPDGEVVTNGYDAAGNLASVVGAGAGWSRTYVDQLRYDVFGNRIHARYGNGVTTDWAYDPNRIRLTKIDTLSPTVGPLQALRYSYDPASNPLEIDNALPPLTVGDVTIPGASSLSLTYDGVDRLTHAVGHAQYDAQKTTDYDQQFGYSPSHNLLHKQRLHTITEPGGIVTTQDATTFASDYAYSPARPHLPTQIGTLAIAYDPSGNPITREQLGTGSVQTLTWDDDNRLVQYQGGGVNQRNSYDASGRRVVRKSSKGETIFSSQYFDLENGTQGVKHIFAGAIRVASELTKFPKGGGTNLDAPKKQGTAYFFHADQLESTHVLTDESGAVQESLEFFVDGEQWIDRGSQNAVNKYLFSGKPFDPDTGFYDYGERYYDSRTSLWIGVDPAFKDLPTEALMTSFNLSPITFANDSPARMTDYDGRQPDDFRDLEFLQQRTGNPVQRQADRAANTFSSYDRPLYYGTWGLAVAVTAWTGSFALGLGPAASPGELAGIARGLTLAGKAAAIYGVLTAKTEGEALFAVIGLGAGGAKPPSEFSGGAGWEGEKIGEKAGGIAAQRGETWCGLACGEHLSGISQESLAETVAAPTTPESLADALGPGWKGGTLDAPPARSLQYLMRKGNPWAALLGNGQKVGHWVVVQGIDEAGNIVVLDPAGMGSTYALARDKFLKLWKHPVAVFHD